MQVVGQAGRGDRLPICFDCRRDSIAPDSDPSRVYGGGPAATTVATDHRRVAKSELMTWAPPMGREKGSKVISEK